jgi:excisionase family DNA binding protein
MGPPLSLWDATMAERLLTVPELAERWRCSPRFVWSLTATGALPVIRLGRLVRVRVRDLEAFEAARLEGGGR